MSDRQQRMLGVVKRALPVGQAVRYFPVDGEQNSIKTVIASEPWALGHGCIVIKLLGRAGCVAIDHLELIG